jgi:oxaloacetate decarboxylase alpha subunit
LTYALFPQIGLMFLENRDNPDAFEPPPWEVPEKPVVAEPAAAPSSGGAGVYSVRVNGKQFTVEVAESGQLTNVAPASAPAAAAPAAAGGTSVKAVLAGNIFKVNVAVGATVEKGDPLLVVEAMKMETIVASPSAGTITEVFVAEGDTVSVGDALVAIG